MNELHKEAVRRNIQKAIAVVRNKAKNTHIEFTCLYCGKKEMLPQSIVNGSGGHGARKYCSWECRNKAMIGDNAANFGRGEKMEGEKNPNWKGGISDDRNKRFVKESAKWRRLVYARDNYECQRCGDSNGGNLNAHHIFPWVENSNKRFDVSNGITLCKPCHDWIHSKENGDNELLCKS